MKTLNITLTKSPLGNWHSVVRSVVSGKASCVRGTKTLKGHIEVLKDVIFKEIVTSRKITN